MRNSGSIMLLFMGSFGVLSVHNQDQFHLEVVDVSRRTTTNHLEVKLGKY